VRIAKARGPENQTPSCAEWPHCVRPEGYYLGAFSYTPNSTNKPKPKSVSVPKKLAKWMAANPTWVKKYDRIEDKLFRMLDAFFTQHPAPPAVLEQAVKHAIQIYLSKHRQKTIR
jgi:hypothetical protein